MLDLGADVGALTAALVDVESVSGDEQHLADVIEGTLGRYATLTVERDGNVVMARTDLRRSQRIVLAGHLDTVPVKDNIPARVEGGLLFGCGAADMKSGLAVMLRLAHLVATNALAPRVDLTWIFYDCEEIDAKRNGLGRVARDRPETLQADLAVLLEPTGGVIEGGCQGTVRAVVRVGGVRAHSARSWLGVNAIHAAAPVLDRLAAYDARTVDVAGLAYHEGMNAVCITGGVAGNVIPDDCRITVNYRFAPDRSETEAHAHLREVFDGFDVDIVDSAPAASPGLDLPLPQAIAAAVGGEPRAKLGWTDVARFSQLGIPAVNYGPGDPNVAHQVDEYVELALIIDAEAALIRFLT